MFDLLQSSAVLVDHVQRGKVIFGLNHKMTDFATHKEKRLDLVVARPGAGILRRPKTFEQLVDKYDTQLTDRQRTTLESLSTLQEGSVGAVLLAVEAKAAMTAHVRALPRLYDELNSSHQIVHGASADAIAVGFVMINAAVSFVSPDRNRAPLATLPPVVSRHTQPTDTLSTLGTIGRIPRRARVGGVGFDAMAVVVIESVNDPTHPTPVNLVTIGPAPQPGQPFYYDDMVTRAGHLYDARFAGI
jgi:hypothetical protein